MKLQVKHPQFYATLNLYFSTMVRFLLNVLLVMLVVAMGIEVVKCGQFIWHNLTAPDDVLLRGVLIKVISMLALVEIFKTVLSYLQEGSVHITFIIDTVLIVMLNEVITLWYSKPKMYQVTEIAVLLGVLSGARILAILHSPNKVKQEIDVKITD